ncbi:GNAT family N-acetyltransferase [Eisenibacter elegans]|uniref:GNAT family N-acetyltransferase n=1 Tax=Eisenibacter elegans TaxID=997 RepID=UPI0013787ACD|nr:GNAT family N-acetyltransferase [Eisenibacter elegans]
MSHLHLYTHADFADLPWTQYRQGAVLQQLFAPLSADGKLIHFATNAPNQCYLLAIDDLLLPLVEGNSRAEAATYLSSPTSQYIDLTIEEIQLEIDDNNRLKPFAAPVLRLAKRLCKACLFDKVLFVNNWLVSTNLYPAISEAQLQAMIPWLFQHFPQHAIVFRSVNECDNVQLLAELCALKGTPIISRQVYMLFTQEEGFGKKRMYKSDQKLWQKQQTYTWELIQNPSSEELDRIQQLYNQLYLEKYSSFNPHYTTTYIAALIQSAWMPIWVLRHRETGRIDGVSALYACEGVLTTPLIGYDRNHPQALDLYRYLSFNLIQEARQQAYPLVNLSSGAAPFKKMRGGIPYLEYNLAFYRHLPWWRRLPWQLFRFFSVRFAIPAMQRYGL